MSETESPIPYKKYKTRTFFVLWIACLVGATCLIPYVSTNSLLRNAIPSFTVGKLAAAVLVQSSIFFAIFVLIGVSLGHRVGLGVPFISGRIGMAPVPGFQRIAIRSVLVGLVAGALIFILDRHAFGIFIPPITRAQDDAAWWSRLLVGVYGGIDEEIAFRFAFMTLLVWVSWKIRSTAENRPTAVGLWISIVTASVVFGLMHLPIGGRLVVVTPLAIVRAIVLNSFVGVPCGWFYWKDGLESAMLIHFSGDLALHGVLPLISH